VVHDRLVGAHAQNWTASIVTGIDPKSAQIGYARPKGATSPAT